MSSKSGSFRSTLAVLAGASIIALAVSACIPKPPPPPPPPPSPTLEGLKSVIENLSLEPLGPAGEGVQVLMKADEITKAGLIVWLRKKEADAASAMDEHRQMWYRANLDCLAQGDCADLRKMQRDKEAKKPINRPPTMPPKRKDGESSGNDGGGSDGGHGGM